MNGNRIVKLSAVAIMALTLMSCSSKNGNYLNILQLPGTLLDSVFDNSSSKIKREKVEAYAKLHYDALKKEIKLKEGKHLDTILKLAGIETSHYSKIKIQLNRDYKTIFHNTQRVSEKLVQNMSRLYEVKEKTKEINGFSYTQISEISKKYVENHFETIRRAIKDSKSEIFVPLAEQLNIKESKKKDAFINSLNGKHFELYTDLVVVAVMVEGI
jgi:hypothetical protein